MEGLGIGRIVHYRAYGTPQGEYPAACRAAIITEVVDGEQGLINLCVVNPTGLFFNQRCPYDPTGTAGGSWHWPERV